MFTLLSVHMFDAPQCVIEALRGIFFVPYNL